MIAGVAVAGAVGIAAIWLACRGPRTSAAEPEGMRTAKARRGSLEIVCVEEGTLRPVRQTTVACREGGKIAWLHPEGERVAKGDRLVALESTDQEDEVKRLRDDALGAEKALAEGERILALARGRLDAEQKAEQDRVALERMKEAELLAAPTQFAKADAEASLRAATARYQAAESELASISLLAGQGFSKEAELRATRMRCQMAECELSKERLRCARVVGGANDFERRRAALARLGAELRLDLKRLDRERELGEQEWTVNSSRSKLDYQRRQLRKRETALVRRTVTAPHDGLVVHREPSGRGRKIEVGDWVYPHLGLVDLPDLSRMKARTQVPESCVRFLEEGKTPALVSTKAESGRKYRGVVSWIDRWARDRNASLSDADRRTQGPSGVRVFNVEVEISDEDPAHLHLGFRASCEIRVRTVEDAVIVPREAVSGASGGARVTVLEEGRPRSVPVTLGPESGGEIVVTAGLDGGETLLLPSPSGAASASGEVEP